ncbi:isoprenylcysteine carboxylmethyltransferase family protein [Microlunatus aurantiacus]|uniref:Isoprenylcysteine carboxylmethyltransferase family protein n=1 Tax=Microlunatus aurantiacus TaxID=446786 RepID=A0ABP7EH70_9ACTN
MNEWAAPAAGLLYAAAVVLLLIRRSWRQYRLTGSTGFNGFRGAAQDPSARVGGIGFAAAVVIGLVAPWLATAGLLPVWNIPLLVAGLGALAAAAGVQLGVTAQQAMGRSWRIGVDQAETTALVTDGPFRLVRNPIFTALMMIQAGTATMAPTWLSLLGAVLMTAACQIQTRLVEEPYLLRRHDTAYPAYAAEAGRFVPGAGRLRDVTAASTPHSSRGRS